MNKYQEALELLKEDHISNELNTVDKINHNARLGKIIDLLQELVDKFEIDEDYEIIKHKPQLTEDEKVILRNLHEEYKWICRLYDDTLYVTDVKPQSSQSQWGFANCQYAKSIPFENIFQFITWEDEPYLIEDLLK